MKVYRIIPNTMTLEDNSGFYFGYEDIFFDMGYISLPDEKSKVHSKKREQYVIKVFENSMPHNTFGYHKNSRFFYFNIEDALRFASNVLESRRLSTTSFVLEEIDIPEDILAKYMGLGEYDYEKERFTTLEFLIPYSELGEKISYEIPDYDIRSFMFYALNNSIKFLRSKESKDERLKEIRSALGKTPLDFIPAFREYRKPIILDTPFEIEGFTYVSTPDIEDYVNGRMNVRDVLGKSMMSFNDMSPKEEIDFEELVGIEEMSLDKRIKLLKRIR